MIELLLFCFSVGCFAAGARLEYRKRKIGALLAILHRIAQAIEREKEELRVLSKHLAEYDDRKGDNALLRNIYNDRARALNKHIERYAEAVVKVGAL